MAQNEVMLLITAPRALEDVLLDWLLARGCDAGAGFTSYRVGGHSSRLDALSTIEQVSGRRRGAQFQIVLNEEAADALLSALGEDFPGASVHYWVVPVLRAGRLDGGSEESAAERTETGGE